MNILIHSFMVEHYSPKFYYDEEGNPHCRQHFFCYCLNQVSARKKKWQWKKNDRSKEWYGGCCIDGSCIKRYRNID